MKLMNPWKWSGYPMHSPLRPVVVWEMWVLNPPNYKTAQRERWVEIRIIQSLSLVGAVVLVVKGALVAALLVAVLPVLAAAKVWPAFGGPALRFKLPGALGLPGEREP